MQQLTNSNSSGFTLIELLITVSLAVILMLGASAMFMVFLISNTKTAATQLIKHEGEHALAQMEFLLRNAIELQTNNDGQICEQSMDSINFLSTDEGLTALFTDDVDQGGSTVKKIASNSSYLTSGAVELVADGDTSSLVFNCTDSPDGKSQYINISFTLRKGTPGIDKPRDIVEESFSTGVTIRSF